ncbi:MAG: PDZ domain-containing protein [Thermanaeromonas sp.]|uniref:PDZ domain-containing protein n=1 Tax=Thermanaeromonas sp. TaxID=2003697 RepID=UPI00243A728E|nr:PDZ domain-containing protein [Thermanaeromonas sp.]MCG0277448.1 PDZ domain-containing protein [Thermanaeromonas sp.]
MLPLKQIVPFILQAQLSLLVSPLFWLLVLVIAYQYRRLARLKEELFGVRGETAWQPVLTALAYGVLGGLGGSFIMVLVGVSLSGIGINYLWIVALLLMLVNPRFLCFSYAGGLISLAALILGRPQVDVPHLMGLVAVLHMVEAFLIRVSGHLGAIPVYTSHQGRVVGAFNMQKFWPIPIAALALITLPPWLSPGEVVPMPDWWPLIRPAVMPDPKQALFVILPVAAGLGYGDLALSSRPEEKSRLSARNLALYSLTLLVLSILASYYRSLTWLSALFGPLGHEYIIWLGRRVESKGEPIYVPSELGARLLDVIRNSPAARLGLRSGDILLRVNGYPVRDRETLKAALEGSWEQVEVVFYREGEGEKVAKVYKQPLEPLGVILVPEPGDNPQVELMSSGWLARWWREKRR